MTYLNADLFPKAGIKHEKTVYIEVGIKLIMKWGKNVFNLINNPENLRNRNSKGKVIIF